MGRRAVAFCLFTFSCHPASGHAKPTAQSLLLSGPRTWHVAPLHNYYYHTDTWEPNVNQCASVVAACKHPSLCFWDYGEGCSWHVWSRADENRHSWFQCRDSDGGVLLLCEAKLICIFWPHSLPEVTINFVTVNIKIHTPSFEERHCKCMCLKW